MVEPSKEDTVTCCQAQSYDIDPSHNEQLCNLAQISIIAQVKKKPKEVLRENLLWLM